MNTYKKHFIVRSFKECAILKMYKKLLSSFHFVEAVVFITDMYYKIKIFITTYYNGILDRWLK